MTRPGPAHPSGEPEITPVSGGVCVDQYLDFYLVFFTCIATPYFSQHAVIAVVYHVHDVTNV